MKIWKYENIEILKYKNIKIENYKNFNNRLSKKSCGISASLSLQALRVCSTIKRAILKLQRTDFTNSIFVRVSGKEVAIYLARTPEIGQGLGRFLSCGARKQEQP